MSESEHGRDEPEWPDTLVVPDDPSELRADELALRRERSAARRRARWYRLTGGSRLRAYGISVPVTLVAIAAVAGFGALLVLLGPRTSPLSAPPAPGVDPTAPAGRAGGRLPSAPLTLPDGATVDAGSLTGPAVVLLVPAGCGCAQTVVLVADHAGRAGLRTDVVEPTTSAASGVDGGAPQQVTAYVDPSGRLLSTYGSTGTAPTLLVLDAYSAVRTVRTGLTPADAAAVFPLPPAG